MVEGAPGNRGPSGDSPGARSPQAGQHPCVGEEMDGERTHRCHRRCGHRGQPPPARQRRGIQVWTTAWTECRRTAGGCGRRRRIPRPSWACTRHPQSRPQPGPSECELSGEVACPSGARKGEVLPAAGSVWATHRVAVDELGRVARHTGSRWYPQECPQPVDLWTKGSRTGIRREVTEWSRGHTQVGRSLWTTSRCTDIRKYLLSARWRDIRESRGRRGEGRVSRPAA